eukprot:TRINITY_DN2118_c0_g1_i1.p1 TRINITY_DN2118_c0_g1~~TRINITY_DN2118_c0_g1_i1.p1  ORF type:complete len:789 (+),score=73.61 TRINITY_DN2118_c0_g1_i1:490-2856(+)
MEECFPFSSMPDSRSIEHFPQRPVSSVRTSVRTPMPLSYSLRATAVLPKLELPLGNDDDYTSSPSTVSSTPSRTVLPCRSISTPEPSNSSPFKSNSCKGVPSEQLNVSPAVIFLPAPPDDGSSASLSVSPGVPTAFVAPLDRPEITLNEEPLVCQTAGDSQDSLPSLSSTPSRRNIIANPANLSKLAEFVKTFLPSSTVRDEGMDIGGVVYPRKGGRLSEEARDDEVTHRSSSRGPVFPVSSSPRASRTPRTPPRSKGAATTSSDSIHSFAISANLSTNQLLNPSPPSLPVGPHAPFTPRGGENKRYEPPPCVLQNPNCTMCNHHYNAAGTPTTATASAKEDAYASNYGKILEAMELQSLADSDAKLYRLPSKSSPSSVGVRHSQSATPVFSPMTNVLSPSFSTPGPVKGTEQSPALQNASRSPFSQNSSIGSVRARKSEELVRFLSANPDGQALACSRATDEVTFSDAESSADQMADAPSLPTVKHSRAQLLPRGTSLPAISASNPASPRVFLSSGSPNSCPISPESSPLLVRRVLSGPNSRTEKQGEGVLTGGPKSFRRTVSFLDYSERMSSEGGDTPQKMHSTGRYVLEGGETPRLGYGSMSRRTRSFTNDHPQKLDVNGEGEVGHQSPAVGSPAHRSPAVGSSGSERRGSGRLPPKWPSPSIVLLGESDSAPGSPAVGSPSGASPAARSPAGDRNGRKGDLPPKSPSPLLWRSASFQGPSSQTKVQELQLQHQVQQQPQTNHHQQQHYNHAHGPRSPFRRSNSSVATAAIAAATSDQSSSAATL